MQQRFLERKAKQNKTNKPFFYYEGTKYLYICLYMFILTVYCCYEFVFKIL